jgi:cytochrome c oxidase assembly factor CtaG
VPAWQRQIMWSFHMAVSIIVAFVCPVGFLTGAAGSVILWMNRGQSG